MSLIKCNECGKEISDKVAFCIHCGNPINNNNEIDNKSEEIIEPIKNNNTNYTIVKPEELALEKKKTMKVNTKKGLIISGIITAILILIIVFLGMVNILNIEIIIWPIATIISLYLSFLFFKLGKQRHRFNIMYALAIVFSLLTLLIGCLTLFTYDYDYNLFNIEKTVPDVTNLTSDKAVDVLFNYYPIFNFQSVKYEYQYDDNIPKDHVISTIPKPGEKQKIHNEITIIVSLGKEMTPKEKIIDYLENKENYSCYNDVCSYTFTLSRVTTTDYYTIDFSKKLFSILGKDNTSSYYREFNWGTNKGYGKFEMWNVLYSYITIDLTYDEKNSKYSWKWNSTRIGNGSLCDTDNCKTYAKDIMDLYDDFIKICNNAGVNKNEL